MPKPPLRLYLLAHPQSASAVLLARELMRRFNDPPASGGLRVPTSFTPDRGDGLPPAWGGEDGVDLDAADHSLVVVLADARMARRVAFGGEPGTGTYWERFLAEGAERAPVGASPHHVFAVTIAKPRDASDRPDDAVFALAGSRHALGLSKEPASRRQADEPLEDYASRIGGWLSPVADEVALHVAIRAIRLLDEGAVPADVSPEQKAPVRLFLSHAKADLKSDESDAVRGVEDAIKELPIGAWFDAAKIRPAAEFEKEIAAGVRDSSILVAFLTDRYASRPWCRREALDAKRLGAPILVVDALSDGEPRNFAYLGNVPTVHWTGRDRPAEARRVVAQAVREALRFKHNRAALERRAGPGETAVAVPPEVLSLAWQAASESGGRFLYPDPPLPQLELDLVRTLRPGAEFLTPLTKVARARPGAGRCLAVSTSVADDKERLGLSKAHEEEAFDEIHGYFLLAGLRIAYGGALQADISRGTNFTHRLFELVRAYSRLAEDAAAGPVAPVLNVAPWPLRLAYGEDEANLFGVVAEPAEGERPPAAEVPERDEDLFPPGENIHTLPDTRERRLAWARGLTAMRAQATRLADARLVIGGTLSRFKGLLPGVAEEAWMSVAAGQPLFLAGGFGGAASAVADLLRGRDRPELTTASLAASVPHFREAVALAEERGLTRVEPGTEWDAKPLAFAGSLVTPDRVVADLKAAGRAGLAAALHNGLSDEENLELLHSTDPPRIAELVLEGLARIG